MAGESLPNCSVPPSQKYANAALCSEAELGENSHPVVHSQAMLGVFKIVDRVAPYSINVLLTGESGVGKGIWARTLHKQSRRAQGPFVAINCASLPETLLESELFGYEKGSFTGADRQKDGLLELANEGTLFFDEIGELPLHLQAKLLHALDEKKMLRIGGRTEITLNFRLVSATNQDLGIAVREGRFRNDLYHRLNTVHIEIPPLRERPEEIPLLVNYFIVKVGREKELTGRYFTSDALAILLSHSWPGNVRELGNVVEFAVLLSETTAIGRACLPVYLRDGNQSGNHVPSLRQAVEQLERKLILDALHQSGWDDNKAAARIRTTLRILRYKKKKLGIPIDESSLTHGDKCV